MERADNIIVKDFSDYDSNPIEFNIRTIDDLKKFGLENLYIPKRFNFYKIVYVTEGMGKHKVDFMNHILMPQSILPINRNVVQCFCDVSRLQGFVIHFSQKFFLNERENFNYLINTDVFSNQSIVHCSATLEFILNQLKNTYDNCNSEKHHRQIINYLRVLLLEIEMIIKPSYVYSSLYEDELYRKFKEEIGQLVTYQTKVKDISRNLKVNAKRLNFVVKSVTGKNAKALIDENLIMEIKRLLLYSNYSIKEIAYKLEFDEAANFSNYFKRHTGEFPLQFRSKM